MSRQPGGRSAPIGAGLVCYAVAALCTGLAACAVAPSMPDARMTMPQMPTEAEVEEMVERQMGRPDLRDEPDPNEVQVVFQSGHAGTITAVALSADGRYVLSTAWDETAKLWDVASGREIRTFTGIMIGMRAAAFVPGSSRIAVSGVGLATLFDTETGRAVKGFEGITSQGVVSAGGRFAARPVRRSLAFDAGNPRERRDPPPSGITVTELATDRIVASLPTDDDTSPLALSDDGALLLTQRYDLDARSMRERMREGLGAFPRAHLDVWDVPGRRRVRELPIALADQGGGFAFALDPAGRWLVVESVGEGLAVHDLATGERLHSIPTGDARPREASNSLVVSADGRLLARATMDGHVRVWEMPSGRLVKELEGTAVAFGADGRLVTGAADGGAPVLHDLAAGTSQRLASAASAITDLALVDGGARVLAATEGGGTRLWDLTTGELLHTFPCPRGVGASAVSVSPGRPWFAIGCADGGVYLWDLRTRAQLRTLLEGAPGALQGMVSVRFDPSGRLLAVGRQSELVVLDVEQAVVLQSASLPDGPLPIGLRDDLAPEDLVQMGDAQREQVTAARTDPALRRWMQSIRALAFRPDGRQLAIAKGGQLLLWDIDSGRIARDLGAGARVAGIGAEGDGAQPSTQAMNEIFGELMKGGRVSRKALRDLQKRAASGAVIADPREMRDTMRQAMGAEDYLGIASLAFSADGARLYTVGSEGRRTWDVTSGERLAEPQPGGAGALDANDPLAFASAMMDEGAATGSGLALSTDGRLAARGFGRVVKIWDPVTGKDVAELIGHTSEIRTVAFVPGGRLLASGGRDGSIRLWTLPEGEPLAQLIALGTSDYVTVTADQFYRASRRGIGGVAFRLQGQLYPFEQFDLRFNRPDVVLERLGRAPPALVASYRAAWERRARKLGVASGDAEAGELHLPQVTLVGDRPPAATSALAMTLRVRADDAKYPLDRLNVFVNDVPVRGTAGLAIPDRETRTHEQAVEVPLVPGRNKIQVSVLNQQGTESLRQTVYTTSTAPAQPPDVYLVAIGVSRYLHESYNLRFAAKDAADLLAAYQALADRGVVGRVHVLELTNERATRSAIREAKGWLAQARTSDLVVVFAAGHGMTDARSNYFFGTHDIDPERPELNGLPYEDFEALLDGIPALQKVLLIDTCFSGEIEKDEPVALAQSIDTGGAGTVSMRAFKASRGVVVVADQASPSAASGGGVSSGGDAGAAAVDVVRFQQELFADLRRGTGAVVISSASGNEYALEGEQWANGVFTYALLDGLRNGRADRDGNRTINVSELQAHVIEEVRRLTAGGQNPTVRRENLEYDFAVYLTAASNP